MTDFWTPSRVRDLTRMWNAEGLSARKIADKLGCTRNAVIGKTRRLGLDPRKEGVNPNAQARRIAQRADWAERRRIVIDVQVHGGTASDAGKRLGVTPHEAVKIARKLGVPFPHHNTGRKGQRGTVSLPRLARVASGGKPPAPAPAAPVSLDGAIDILSVLDATEFRAGRCKFALNDAEHAGGHLFCGASTSVGTVYCNTHNSVAYAGFPARTKILALAR